MQTTAAVKERPILFSGSMVRAILRGDKTQTRRIVKNPDHYACLTGDCPHWDKAKCVEWLQSECPIGKPGDRLWVRETWRPLSEFDPSPETGAQYWADSHAGLEKRKGDAKWRPSIHMPRWASRLTLEITGVRVERLQDITQTGAIAEGIRDGGCLNCGISNDPTECGCDMPRPDFRDGFCSLWKSINGQQSWHENPWVWVVEFKRILPA